MAGPKPQIQPREVRGDRNVLNSISPMPFMRLPSGDSGGSLMTGTIVRVITDQFCPRDTGTMGSTFSTLSVPRSGPTFRFVLF
jgi:hypothetical protein